MNDFSQLENELKKLRPAQPSPILFERVEQALENDRASVSEARHWWRPPRRMPYNWLSLGFGVAAAAVLILFAAVSMERWQEQGEKIAQNSPAPETKPISPVRLDGRGAQTSTSSNRFVPTGATQVVYNTRDEGLQFARGSGQPLRRLRYQTHQTWQFRNPTTGASLRVSYPSEEVALIPVSGQ
jgi:hypothetical protein